MKVRIAGLGGSLSDRSSSLRALNRALDACAALDADVDLIDIRTLDLPFYRDRCEPVPAGASRLIDAVAKADGMIWSAPLYHGTISGAFKNVLDWLQLLASNERPYLTNKPVGLIAVAGGSHALQGINTMDFAVRALRGWAVPFSVSIHAAQEEAVTESGLSTLAREVTCAARRFAHTGVDRCRYEAQF